MNYDTDPEQRAAALENAVLGGDQTIAGLTLRPMTAATWSLHQRLKRAAGESSGDDWSLNIFSFIFIHSQPVEKLRAAFSQPAVLLGEVFDFMQGRGPAEASIWRGWMETQMEQFTASLTQATERPESPKA